MRISPAGIDFIKRWEGLRLTAYLDVAGVPTIGYGHTRTVSETDVQEAQAITEEEAEQLLRRDLSPHEVRVNHLVKVPFNQNEYDALVSFDFNTAGLHKSTALERLNRNDRIGAAEALTWWNKATIKGELREVRGLTRRREAERALFLAPALERRAHRPATGKARSRPAHPEKGRSAIPMTGPERKRYSKP